MYKYIHSIFLELDEMNYINKWNVKIMILNSEPASFFNFIFYMKKQYLSFRIFYIEIM